MDEKNITLIDNLDIPKDDFTVKVRIIRLWSQPLFKDPEQLYSIEMILMDEVNNYLAVKSMLMFYKNRFKSLKSYFMKELSYSSKILQLLDMSPNTSNNTYTI
ncbi:hypothetical protein OSB04_un000373 [Centaurea solstitialis]|uniref:Uncharacterized protein n=1 Tax=Centaurea solstitialis TaxID=347529 RepID=A0AA38W2Q3_9ASTR|nr:hypothetical protein OSB04_un000373 [Centaurea solstitialis]